MRCKEAYLFICDNLDQPVDSPECREIRRHIADCPDCQSYLDSLKKTVSLYRSMPSPKHVPTSVHQRLMRVIQLKAKSPTRTRKPSSRSSHS